MIIFFILLSLYIFSINLFYKLFVFQISIWLDSRHLVKCCVESWVPIRNQRLLLETSVSLVNALQSSSSPGSIACNPDKVRCQCRVRVYGNRTANVSCSDEELNFDLGVFLVWRLVEIRLTLNGNGSGTYIHVQTFLYQPFSTGFRWFGGGQRVNVLEHIIYSIYSIHIISPLFTNIATSLFVTIFSRLETILFSTLSNPFYCFCLFLKFPLLINLHKISISVLRTIFLIVISHLYL